MRPVNLKFLHNASFFFFKIGAKSEFELCSGPITLGAGVKPRLESRIKKFTPHCVCRPGMTSQQAKAAGVFQPYSKDKAR